VLDRKTFDQIGEVAIAPDDDTYQDNIISITSDKNNIYARVEYRYEQAGRPNFFVIDKSSLAVTKKSQINVPGSLVMDGDNLLACGCGITTDGACKAVNVETFETRDVDGKICLRSEVFGAIDSNMLVTWQTKNGRGEQYVASTKDYVVTKTYGPRDNPYIIYPKSGGTPRTVGYGERDSLSWPRAVDENTIVVTENTRDTVRIKEIDASTGIEKTLFGVPIKPFRGPVIAASHGIMFVGIGRDLVVYDLADRSVRRYIKDYIVAPPNRASNIDANQITRLLIDEGRLIALTFRGENSRVARLSDLTKKIR